MLSLQQRNERRGYIGASDVPCLMGFNEWKKPWHVYWSKMPEDEQPDEIKEANEKPDSKAVKYGNFLESVILDMAADYLVHEIPDFDNYPQFHRDETVGEGILRSNLDMRADKFFYRKKLIESPCIIEAKSTGFAGTPMEEWGRAGSQDVPPRVMLQVQAQLMCTQFEWAWIALLSGHNAKGLRMYRIKPNKKVQAHIEETCKRFWNDYVLTKTPPPKEMNYA